MSKISCQTPFNISPTVIDTFWVIRIRALGKDKLCSYMKKETQFFPILASKKFNLYKYDQKIINLPVGQVDVFTICFSLYMLNAKTQGFKIQDANRIDWIFFQYIIDVTSYSLGKGFLATYSIGMKHNTFIFRACQTSSVPYSKLLQLESLYIRFHLIGECQARTQRLRGLHYQSQLLILKGAQV